MPWASYSLAGMNTRCLDSAERGRCIKTSLWWLQARELETWREDLDLANAQTASLLEAHAQAESGAHATAQHVADLEARNLEVSAQLQHGQQQVCQM